MKTLADSIADALVWVGLVKPSSNGSKVSLPHTSPDQRTGTHEVARVIKTEKYDPDKEYIDAADAGPKVLDFTDKSMKIASAQLYEVSTDGKAYKLVTVHSQEALIKELERGTALRESAKPALAPWSLREADDHEKSLAIDQVAKQMLEASFRMIENGITEPTAIKEGLREMFKEVAYDGFSQDWYMPPNPAGSYGTGTDPYAEYIPIMGGPWQKQLYLQQHLEMHAKSFEAFNHNPVAKQIIELTTAFCLSRGIDFVCTNVEVDEVMKEFIDRTEFYERLEKICTDAWWSGNLMQEFLDNTPSRGLTDFREIDPSTIWDIITDTEDIRKVYYAHQQYQTAYQNLYTMPTNSAAERKIPISEYIIRQIPANVWLHMRLNCSSWEKFGRSDLFPILGWLKRLKDLMNARVVKGQMEAAFVWDVEVSTDLADVNNTTMQLPDPYSAGATFIHNKSIQLKATSSDIKGNDAMPDVVELKSMIAVGAMTPKEFIGVADRGSRSASLTSTEYGTKRYERRQMFIERYCHKNGDRVIANAAKAGLIDLDEVLKDARSVKRLGDDAEDMQTRTDVAHDMIDAAGEKQKADQKQAQQQSDMQTDQTNQQNALQPAQPGQAALPPAPKTKLPIPPKPVIPLTSHTLGEAISKIAPAKSATMNDKQLRRIKAIKASGQFSKELVEWTFPSIAQEDRSQKLKDLALSEAMEWLPKEVTASMAAKELNITTYEFADAWRTIVAEAAMGLSIAHVFGQDNKHVPAVVQAQTVQEETAAMAPPQDQATINQPIPPAVNEFKQVPGPGAVKPGQTPNSGDTKVNNAAAPKGVDPTGKAPGYSKQANTPFAGEGRNNTLRRMGGKQEGEIQTLIYKQLLREAIGPLVTHEAALARFILERPAAVAEYEEAVASLQDA